AAESEDMDCIVSASTSKSADNLEVPIITKRPLTPNLQAPGNKADSIQYVKKSKHDFNVRSIIEGHTEGPAILTELDRGELSRKMRIKMVQILVADIIENFGDRLISWVEMDFRILYPDVAENLFLRMVPTLVKKILSYAHLQGTKWLSYLNIRTENLKTDEQKMNIAISLLPCILPTGRNGEKRCSIDEAMRSFLDVKPIGTNMPKLLEEASRSPFILAIGARESPNQVFVVVDGQGLEQPSLVKAVDVCFKLFYILDVHYPWQCAVTWEFIQKVLYGIEDKLKGKTSPAVIAMRAALNK
ncbi:Hypothetical predicted protein, partial [Paramuricea clavata]